MSWFAAYVDGVVQAWQVRQRPPSLAGFREFLQKEGFASTDIGDIGEQIVEREFADRGHLTARSPGSRSPADVFALGDFESAGRHLILTQVKTGFYAQSAVPSRQDLDDLQVFSAFAVQHWLTSADVPAETKQELSVVSFGYATIQLKYTNTGFGPVSSRYSYQGSIARREHADNLVAKLAAQVFLRFLEKEFGA